MTSGRMEYELAIVAVLCVLAIFLFPASTGSYSVVHGPVTALLAFRFAARLRASIVQGASRILSGKVISPLVGLSWTRLSCPNLPPLAAPEGDTVLRC
jgi:hypothetical protein